MNIIQQNEDLFSSIKNIIDNGLPTIGTCAGAILLARNLSNDNRQNLNVLNVTIERNAYGRQVNSFRDELSISINNSSTINKIKKNTLDYNLLKKDSDCSICLEPFSKDKEIIILECKHIYHTDCIVQWLNKDISCPLCRESSLI